MDERELVMYNNIFPKLQVYVTHQLARFTRWEGQKTMFTSKANNICKYGVTSTCHQVFLSEKLYEDEEVDLPIPIIYYSR